MPVTVIARVLNQGSNDCSRSEKQQAKQKARSSFQGLHEACALKERLRAVEYAEPCCGGVRSAVPSGSRFNPSI